MSTYLADTEEQDIAELSGTFTADEASKVLTFGSDGEANTFLSFPQNTSWLLIEVYDVEGVYGAKGYQRYTTNTSNIDWYNASARAIALSQYTTFKISTTHYKGNYSADVYIGDESNAMTLSLTDTPFAPPASWLINRDTTARTIPPDGLIVPTLTNIWDNSDTTLTATNFPSGVGASFSSSTSPVVYSAPSEVNFPSVGSSYTVPWYLTAEEGDSGCSLPIGTSTNTCVEVGALMVWWLLSDNTWYLAYNTKTRAGGTVVPDSQNPWTDNLGCSSGDVLNLRTANLGYNPSISLSSGGYNRSTPDHCYFDNGWQDVMAIPVGVKAQFIQQYFRLTLIDPNGVDDRNLAKFVHCVGADNTTSTGGKLGNVGIGRWKRAISTWQSATMLTGGYFSTLADLQLNPPPIAQLPDGSDISVVVPPQPIITNSYQMVWDDMHSPNTGWVSDMPDAYAQFQGAFIRTLPSTGYDIMNCWIEIEAGGDGSGCSVDTNTSTNSMVEIGSIRLWERRGGVWTKLVDVASTRLDSSGAGGWYPTASGAGSRPCGLDEATTVPAWEHRDLMNTEYGVRTNANGHDEVRPEFYYRWHCWGRTLDMAPVSEVQGVVGTVYLRLVLKDQNGVDDRSTSNIVSHVSGDKYSYVTGYGGDIGLSRYKKVTSQWQPFNIYSFPSGYEPTSVNDLIAIGVPIATTP